jgi:hypothetical protein
MNSNEIKKKNKTRKYSSEKNKSDDYDADADLSNQINLRETDNEDFRSNNAHNTEFNNLSNFSDKYSKSHQNQTKKLKYNVNLKNIERINKSVENNLNSKSPSSKITSTSKAQVIVISRKRQREDDTENEIKDLMNSKLTNFDNQTNPYKKIKLDLSSSESITESDKLLSLSQKLTNLNLNLNFTDHTLNRQDSTNTNKIKDRNIKIFSSKANDKCTLCNHDDGYKHNEDSIYRNFYPTLTTTNSLTSNLTSDSHAQSIEKTSTQFSQVRQLKFLEKRNLLSRNLLSTEFGGEIKNLYTKLHGECKVVNNTKDKIVILNPKPMTEQEIQNLINSQTDKKDMSYFVMDIDTEKCKNDDEIMRQVNIYEENLVADANLSEDSRENPELDYDSNREDNSCNDYPDEEDSEDEYDHYNTNSNSKSDYYTSIRIAEKKLNKAFVEYNQQKCYDMD